MEAEGEAEKTSDLIHVEFMPASMIGPSAGTMSTTPTIAQTDKLVVGVEAANNIGVEAEASGVTITIRIQAEEMYRITMAATIKARCNHNVNNIITNTADCLSQIAPWVPQQYHLIAIIKLRPERLRHKAM